MEDGRRLAAALPRTELHVIDGARTFSMLDQPDRLVEIIAGFVGGGDTHGSRRPGPR